MLFRDQLQSAIRTNKKNLKCIAPRNSQTQLSAANRERLLKPLFKLFWLKRDIRFAGSFFLPVLLHPVFPTFAGSHVASSESEGGNIDVGHGHTAAAIFGKHANKTIAERFSLAAIEDIALDFAAVFAGDEDVAAVVKGLLECGVDFFRSRQIRHRAFEFLMFESSYDFARLEERRV